MSLVTKIILSFLIFSNFSIYCSAAKGGTGKGGVTICAADGSWHDGSGCTHGSGNSSGSAGNSGGSQNSGNSGDCYIGYGGVQCTKMEIWQATIALNNLNDSLPATTTALIANFFGGDKVRFACAAEHITGKCLLPGQTHTCYKSGQPQQVLSESEQKKMSAAQAYLKSLGQL